MSFGLANAPITFIKFMSRIFLPYLDSLLIVFIDDMMICSKNKVKHMRHLRVVLQKLSNEKLYVLFPKRKF